VCRIDRWLRRIFYSGPCYPFSVTEDERNYLLQTRAKLARWITLANAGTLGPSLKDTPVDVALDIADMANKLYDWYVPPFTIDRVRLEENELNSIINDLNAKGGLQQWLRLDDKYFSVDRSTFEKIIQWDWTDTRKYLSDTFDCDKFAMYFKSRMAIDFGINAVGVIFDYSAGHAYNIVIIKDQQGVEWLLYEPQNDNIFKYEDRDTKMYKMQNYYLVL